jgi:conjugal transfer ATP-binding protein TraC
MLRTLIDDLDGALRATRIGELLRPPSAGPQARNDAASFSHWLPYRAWLEDRQVFVNRDALGFCLELRPQSGADEEMSRILTSLYEAAPSGTGIQFHLLASPDIRGPLGAYADLRVPDEFIPELNERGRLGRHTNIHRTLARRRVGHYLRGARQSLLPNQSYLLRRFRLVASVCLPGSPENLGRIDELLLLRDGMRATLHAASGIPAARRSSSCCAS